MNKILHLITSLEGGGTENFLHQIVTHSPPGYVHTVLYLKKEGVIGERLRRAGIDVRPAGSLLALPALISREKPRLLHTCLYSAHIVGRWLGRFTHTPVVTSQRAIDLWQKPWQTWLDTQTLPLSSAVIVNSHKAARVIEQRRKDRLLPDIFEVPNGVDVTLFQPKHKTEARQRYGIPQEAIVGGTLMRLHPEKGADFIPRFAEPLLKAFPQLHLLVGGTGQLARSLRDQMTGKTGAERLHWVGWQDDTPTFLSACDFFWSLSREESFPQTLVEASIMGLPWVAPDVGSVSDLIQAGAAGTLYPRLNIANAIEKTSNLLAQLPDTQKKALQAIPALAQHYSLKKMVEKTYAVFARF